jgi:Protein of unknown function (DUF4054)
VAVTVEQIKAEFTEFANTDSALITAKIGDATAMLNATAFGDRHDYTVKYLACHLVALSPGGEFARLDPNKEPDGARTLYEREYLRLLRSIAGPMVV